MRTQWAHQSCKREHSFGHESLLETLTQSIDESPVNKSKLDSVNMTLNISVLHEYLTTAMVFYMVAQVGYWLGSKGGGGFPK